MSQVVSASPILREGFLFCLVGAAASGKTTLGDRLLASPAVNLSRTVSVTSRLPRPGERNGVDYHFVSPAEFQAKVSAKEFFEWEQIHGNYYGTLQTTLQGAIAGGRDLLVRIDIEGTLKLKAAFSRNTVVVFLVPPSSAALKERLRARGDISEQEFVTRLQTAQREYKRLLDIAADPAKIDYLLVNDDMEAAYGYLEKIVAVERVRLARMNQSAVKILCQA